MSYKLIDLHIHTDNSPDGHHSPMFMCEEAVSKGVRAVAFTDHYDLTVDFEKFRYDKRAEHSFFEVEKARNAFAGKILVLKGIELGEALHDLPKTVPILNAGYDIILGSLHNLKNKPDFIALDYESIDIYEYLDEYFDELIKLSLWHGVDVITHMTCPLRYITGRHGIPVDIERYSGKIDIVLKNIIDTGKALEVNTSELFGVLGKTMPDEKIIKRYRELGGKLITVGSDAHYAADIGKGIPEAIDIISRCGFDKLTFFMKREPMQIDI
ncbi:MAG: histidinol-phosphatase HisJ family protein [Clostridia bacterium]|nr:histidinol-phosphatase HisJ family protein [Clostridia bacterium]